MVVRGVWMLVFNGGGGSGGEVGDTATTGGVPGTIAKNTRVRVRFEMFLTG